MKELVNQVLGPPLHAVFDPLNAMLAGAYMPWARLAAVLYFVGAMAWVFLGLKKGYVNLDAPDDARWRDLRFWTALSMLPHVVVYLWL